MITNPKRIGLLTLIVCLSIFYSKAQVSISSAGNPVNIDFSGFQGTGFSNPPLAGQLSSLNWDISGFSTSYTYGGNNSSGDFARSVTSGGVTTGGIYAFSDGSNEMLWVQPTSGDFTPGSFTLYIQNITGSVIDFLDISYDLVYLNNADRSNNWSFSYSLNNTNYTPLSSLNVVSPEVADGSDSTTSRFVTLSNLGIPDGGLFYLRWTGNDVGGSGSRDELGLDNIQILAPVVNPSPTISFSDSNSVILEGNSTLSVLTTINFGYADTVQVDVIVDMSSTASAGQDFNLNTQTLVFPSNSTANQIIDIDILEDLLAEGSEELVLKLRNPTNTAVLGDSVHTVQILDNDQLSVQFTGFDLVISEDSSHADIGIEIVNANASSTSVDLVLLQGGTADTADFEFTDMTLVFPPLIDSTINISIPITDDSEFEPDETILLALTNFTNGAVSLDSTFTITIKDDDPIPSGPCSNLFFSEYIEGSGNNKALELFNSSSDTLKLSQYRILRYNNGSTSPSGILNLSGDLAPSATFVIANSNADTSILNKADITSTITFFNGDDALVLIHITDTIDVIGRIGENLAWPVIGGTTQNFTLLRSKLVLEGTPDWTSGQSEWEAYPIDFSDSLGSHTTISCSSQTTISFISTSIDAEEGDGDIDIVLIITNPDTTARSVDLIFDTMASTGVIGIDFNFQDSTIAFPASSSAPETYSFSLTDDNTVEKDFAIVFRLVNQSQNTLLRDSVLIVNVEDDDEVELEILPSDTSVNEDVGLLVFNVKLLGQSVDTVYSVLRKHVNSEADFMDFQFVDSVVLFLPMDTNLESIALQIIDDTLDEQDELLIIESDSILLVSDLLIEIQDNDTTIISVENLEKEDILIYPNPITEASILKIEFGNRLAEEIEILTVDGKSVINENVKGLDRILIDFSNQMPSSYILKVRLNDGRIISRTLTKL